MRINNSEGKTIHTQRNNKRRPFSACNVTSFINALKYLDIYFDYPDDMQPEDYFMKLMESKEAYRLLGNRGGNPWNYSEILVDVCNKMLVNSPVCEIKRCDKTDLAAHLLQGNVATGSGSFTRAGHFVCFVGFVTDENELLTKFIIDDPYGNYHLNYNDYNGDNIEMPVKDFNRIIYPKGDIKKFQFFYRE